MKYKVGDKVSLVVEIIDTDEDDPSWGYRCMLPNSVGTWMRERDLEAAAYAAKAAPAPASTAWEPKPGDRVLVEASYSCDDEYGNSVVEIPYSHNGKDGMFPARPVMRSAIVGPAPVRARFAVGDVVVYVPTVEVVIIREVNEIAGCYTASQDGRPTFIALEADLLTLDEARERLGKK